MSEEAVVDTAPVEDTAPETTETIDAPSFRDTFKEKIGEEFKSFEKYGDDESLVNGILAAQKMIGKKGDIPAKDADDETKAEFWKKMGSDNLDVSLPEFGEEFGDTAQGLTEYYGGIKDKMLEIAKEVIPKSGDVNEVLGNVFNEFVKQDAEASRLAEAEARTQIEEATKGVAARAGITVEQLNAQNKEVLDRYGWGNDTQISEMLLTLAKETSNTNTLKDAHLNNTSEGLDMQISELSASDEYLRQTGPKHDVAVKKVTALLNQKMELEKK